MSITWSDRNKRLSWLALATALMSLPFSVITCHVALIVFLVLWGVEGKWRRKLRRLQDNILPQLLLALAFLHLAGLIYTDDIDEGWFGIERKIFFFLLPVAMATSAHEWTRKDLRALFYSLSVACLAAVAICVSNAIQQSALASEANLSPGGYLEATGLNPPVAPEWLFFSYTGLADGISIHPVYLSLYIGFCSLFLLHEMLTRDSLPLPKWLLGLVVVLFTAFLVFLSARIILLSMFMAYFCTAAYYFLRRRQRVTAMMVTVLLFGGVALMYVNPVSWYRNWQELVRSPISIKKNHFYTSSVEMRASLWWLGWKSFRQSNALIGAGTGDVLLTMDRTAKQYEISNSIDSKNPHNQYLYFLIGNGVVALLAFLLYLLVPFHRAIKGRDYLMVAFTFLFAALCVTETALELQKGIIFFSIVHSLLAFCHPVNEVQTVDLTLSRASN